MKHLGRGLLVLTVVASSWTICTAQTPEPLFVRQSQFRIPFQIDIREQSRVREVQLYVSEDQGRTWRMYGATSPDQKLFAFQAPRDGLYWFAVRTMDQDGRVFPAEIERLTPALQVIVDTAAPAIGLRELTGGGQIGLAWEVRDEYLDLSSLQLEYRSSLTTWQRVPIGSTPTGQKYWVPDGNGPWEVRFTAADRAGNVSQRTLLVGAGASAQGQPLASPHGVLPPAGLPAQPDVKYVNTTRIQLEYTVEDVGPSGVSSVELWYTLDGRTWQRYGEDADKTSPFSMEVNGEGIFGLTLVVRSGVGLGGRPPQLGDPPQLWVEVDLTKPMVQIFPPEPGRGSEAGRLTITWHATDKNLAPQPIALFWAEKPEGPWNEIAKGLENTGRYIWQVPPPPACPCKFYVKVEAVDRAGNVGVAQTAQPVIVDLSQPRGRLLGIVR
ncbi:MAG: hypothetical protein C4297_08710 [Gemmataceae bacterium]